MTSSFQRGRSGNRRGVRLAGRVGEGQRLLPPLLLDWTKHWSSSVIFRQRREWPRRGAKSLCVSLDCRTEESCLVDRKIFDRRSQRSQSLVDAVIFLCDLCDLLFNGSPTERTNRQGRQELQRRAVTLRRIFSETACLSFCTIGSRQAAPWRAWRFVFSV